MALFGLFKRDSLLPQKVYTAPVATPEEIKKGKTKVSPARTSEPPQAAEGWGSLDNTKDLVEPGWQFEVIPLIRKLTIANHSVSQALANYVALANTGHKIIFDSSVSAEEVDKMREHINVVSKTWHYGTAGMHGIINKLIAQAMIGGAPCAEVIPNLELTGVGKITFPLPESIRFVYNKVTETYEPYQKTKTPQIGADNFNGLKKLNPNTFRYCSINGDTELPYGNPPYLPSLGPLADQKAMLKNIQFIIRQMGIMGFLELLVDKPDQNAGESDDAYAARLSRFLLESKNAIKDGMNDGVMVGYQEDHEFKFHTASATAQGVSELYGQNERLVFSGLKQDPSLSGRSGGSTETNITIIFTKLISELKNIQSSVAEIVEYAYTLEFRLAGFNFKKLTVQMNASTIQDDLKLQQAREIKIRNARQLRMDGILSQDQYADDVDVDKPAQQEPVVPFMPDKSTGDPNLDAQKKAVREKSKDKSDRDNRAKKKPQGKTKS